MAEFIGPQSCKPELVARLIFALYLVAQEFEVPWTELVAQRSGVHSKRRWNLMVKHVPDCREKSFAQCLDYLVDTYAPKLRQALELASTN